MHASIESCSKKIYIWLKIKFMIIYDYEKCEPWFWKKYEPWLDCPIDTKQYDITQHHMTWYGMMRHKKTKKEYIFEKINFCLAFWKEPLKKNSFQKFPKYFFVHLCCVLSFTRLRHMCRVMSYWYDMTHLDSLIMFINCLPIYLTSSFWSLLWSSSGPLPLTRKDLVINIPNPYGTLWLMFRHFWNCKKWNLVKHFPWNWIIWFHEFFWAWTFLNFLAFCEIVFSKCLQVVIGIK